MEDASSMTQQTIRRQALTNQAGGSSRGHWNRDTHVRYRDDSPTLGRFIEREPIGFEAGDNNWYRFVANGPAGKTDANGLWSWDGDWIQMGVGGLLGLYGADVAIEGCSHIDEAAAATIDGVLPFYDPFENYYADACGNVAGMYQVSRNLGGFSRDIAFIAAIPNLGTWAGSPFAYEVGSTTVTAELYAAMQGMTAIQRGHYLVATYGRLGWIFQTAPGQFGATVGTGLTPGGSLLLIGLFEAVDYRSRNGDRPHR